MVGTFSFTQPVHIAGVGITAGPMEKKSIFQKHFDEFFHEENNDANSYEDLHSLLIKKSMRYALQKAELKESDVSLYIGGDLINQMTPTVFSGLSFKVPVLPVFSACATVVQASLLAALVIQQQHQTVAIGTGSFHAAVERQFRYPIEYGAQKPETAQWTVSTGVVAILKPGEADIVLTHGTIGKIVDLGRTNPYDMGSAMAPAAYDTLMRHLQAMEADFEDYDLIMTGDLGKFGLALLAKLIGKPLSNLQDAGAQFYGSEPFARAGASGAGCSAAVYYSHVYEQMKQNKWKRVLLVATGALLSPLTFQQGKTIPVVAHAMEWRRTE